MPSTLDSFINSSHMYLVVLNHIDICITNLKPSTLCAVYCQNSQVIWVNRHLNIFLEIAESNIKRQRKMSIFFIYDFNRNRKKLLNTKACCGSDICICFQVNFFYCTKASVVHKQSTNFWPSVTWVFSPCELRRNINCVIACTSCNRQRLKRGNYDVNTYNVNSRARWISDLSIMAPIAHKLCNKLWRR